MIVFGYTHIAGVIYFFIYSTVAPKGPDLGVGSIVLDAVHTQENVRQSLSGRISNLNRRERIIVPIDRWGTRPREIQ